MRWQSIRRTLNAGAFVLGALAFQGCSTGCSLVGCVSGLRVHLAALPTGAFQVAVLVDGVVQDAPAEATCAGTTVCYQDILFTTTASERVSVRVTTATGSRVTEIANITYAKSRPNGSGCDPECRNATVTAQLPL